MGNIQEEFDHADQILIILENIQELLGAIFIQEQRNYDMVSIIADKLGADAKRLSFMHEQGKVLAPAPSFMVEDDENSDQEALF
jgi:hypothetical protein